MIMTTCAAAVVLASLGYLVVDYYQTREELERDLLSQADLILENSFAAIEFDDPDAARDTLNTLASKPNIRVACLYQRDGHLFSGYRQEGETGVCPPRAPSEETRFGSESVQLAHDGLQDGKRFGSVLLRSDLAVLARRGRAQLAIVGVLLLRTRCRLVDVVAAAGARVRTMVALARTAADVSSRGDYSIRADGRRKTSSGCWSTRSTACSSGSSCASGSSPPRTRSCARKWRNGGAPSRSAPSCWCASAKPTG